MNPDQDWRSLMQGTITQKNQNTVIYYEGDAVGLFPGPFPEMLTALQGGARQVIFDFSKLHYMNSTGIMSLKESLKASKKFEASLAIVAPTAAVRRALKFSGLTQEIPIFYGTLEAAFKMDFIDSAQTAITDEVDRLLICHKELPIAGALRQALKQHPLKPQYRMVPVRDLKQASKILLEKKVDCILLESSFPLYQVTDFIDRVITDDRIPDMPILIVTTDDHLVEMDLMIRNGAHDILRYPFHPVEAAIRLQTLISYLKDHRPFILPEKVVQPRTWKV
jgi:anti-anti-sigma factor